METRIHKYHENGIEKECWTCPKTYAHRHETEKSATECITRYCKKQNSWTREKLLELLYIWRNRKITKKALGALYGVSGNHISLIIKKAETLEENEQPSKVKLNARL